MKKTFIKIALISLISIGLFSCGNENEKPETPAENLKYQIDTETISLKWTAYKTTEKKPVSGHFRKINIKEFTPAEKIENAIDQVSFSIPISSLATGNESRDVKLVEKFFGIMDNTEFIKGTFNFGEGNNKNGNGVLDLTMNSETYGLPYEYTISNDSMFISATMNIQDWKAENALDSLNVACGILHQAADGITKTWEDVEIKASVGIVRK